MFEKMLAFASVTALACFGLAFTVGGCSSSAPVTPPADGGTADAKVTPPPPNDDETKQETCGPNGAYATMEAFDAQFGWKPPAPRQNVCTADDLAAIAAVQQAASYRDFVAGASAACQACALTTKDSPNWAPIVITNEAGTAGIANYGACFAAVDSAACGKARQYLELCVAAACSECTTQGDLRDCFERSKNKQCETMFVEAQTQCTKLAEADASCGSLQAGIEYLCAYEDADAGPDGG